MRSAVTVFVISIHGCSAAADSVVSIVCGACTSTGQICGGGLVVWLRGGNSRRLRCSQHALFLRVCIADAAAAAVGAHTIIIMITTIIMRSPVGVVIRGRRREYVVDELLTVSKDRCDASPRAQYR
jgi:hypothetical protein